VVAQPRETPVSNALTASLEHAAPAWLRACDPRLRIVAAVLFAVVTVGLHQFTALLAAFGVALALALTAGPLPQLLRRAAPLEGFMLLLLLSLPFTVPGHTWFELGPLAASHEGLSLALSIVLKAGAVALMLFALLATLDMVVFGHALARLRVPERLVHLFLFTVRYLDLLQDEYRRLRLAMRARAFVPRSDRHTWRSFGWLIGMLLVRSLERSQRILAAMKCRGFDGRLYLLDRQRWRGSDSGWAAVMGLLLGGLLWLDRL
jgi:cobalt/nickel transport system permease protein